MTATDPKRTLANSLTETTYLLYEELSEPGLYRFSPLRLCLQYVDNLRNATYVTQCQNIQQAVAIIR